MSSIFCFKRIGFFIRNFTIKSRSDGHHKTPEKKTTLYGGRYMVTMIPGGGIGPELMGHVKEVFKHGNVPVDFEIVSVDPKTDNNKDFENAVTSIKRNGVAIKGNIETNSKDISISSRNATLRNELDLYVYVLKCRAYPGVPAHQKSMDVVVIRQNTEGEYAMLEHESVKGVVESMKIITRSNSERVARFAFEYAKKNGRKKVTIVHKADILLSDGLFLETAKKVAKKYPDIKHNDMHIDNCCLYLSNRPHIFDVMLMTNLYGAIVSNVVCGLTGGSGLLSGKNYGNLYAVFEPGTRNSGTAITGKNIANPVAMLNASVDMLEYLGITQHAKIIREAIAKTLNKDKIHTPDLGGTATAVQMVDKIIDNMLISLDSAKL